LQLFRDYVRQIDVGVRCVDCDFIAFLSISQYSWALIEGGVGQIQTSEIAI